MSQNTLIYAKDETNTTKVLKCDNDGYLQVGLTANAGSTISIADFNTPANTLLVNADGSINVNGGGSGGSSVIQADSWISDTGYIGPPVNLSSVVNTDTGPNNNFNSLATTICAINSNTYQTQPLLSVSTPSGNALIVSIENNLIGDPLLTKTNYYQNFPANSGDTLKQNTVSYDNTLTKVYLDVKDVNNENTYDSNGYLQVSVESGGSSVLQATDISGTVQNIEAVPATDAGKYALACNIQNNITGYATETTQLEVKADLDKFNFNGQNLKVENQNNISGYATETTLNAIKLNSDKNTYFSGDLSVRSRIATLVKNQTNSAIGSVKGVAVGTNSDATVAYAMSVDTGITPQVVGATSSLYSCLVGNNNTPITSVSNTSGNVALSTQLMVFDVEAPTVSTPLYSKGVGTQGHGALYSYTANDKNDPANSSLSTVLYDGYNQYKSITRTEINDGIGNKECLDTINPQLSFDSNGYLEVNVKTGGSGGSNVLTANDINGVAQDIEAVPALDAGKYALACNIQNNITGYATETTQLEVKADLDKFTFDSNGYLEVNVKTGGGGSAGGVLQANDINGVARNIEAVASLDAGQYVLGVNNQSPLRSTDSLTGVNVFVNSFKNLDDTNSLQVIDTNNKYYNSTNPPTTAEGALITYVIPETNPKGAIGNIAMGETINASSNSNSLTLNFEYNNDSVLSYQDSNDTLTSYLTIWGSVDTISYTYIGVIQPVSFRTGMRNSVATLKLAGFSRIRLYNENTTTALTGVVASVICGGSS